jgi:beta-lactamase regulating signal transducer with metallopeptidase domain
MKVSLMVLLGLLATAILRKQSASVRHFVLAATLVGAAATPALRLVAPVWHASPDAWWSSSRVELIDRPLAVLDLTHQPSSPAAVHTPLPGSTRAAMVVRSLGILWLAGAGASLFVLLVGLSRLAWLASRAERVTAGPWADIAADIARAHGLRRLPALLQSDHPTLLVTWGFARPKVLLPVEAPRWPDNRIRIVLGHELAHIRRGDWMVQMAAELLRSGYWFNPLVWLACRRLRLESEQACDDAVLSLGVEGSTYASELVDLARAFRSERQPLVPAAAIARPSSLERRVRAMLNVRLNRDPITRSVCLAATIVLVAVTMLVAGFGVSAQSVFATLSGSVVDPNGRPIPDVTLKLSNAQRRSNYEVKSDPAGQYEFIGLPAGTYTLLFEAGGFAAVKREGIAIAGQPFQVDAVMQVGSVTETITVSEDQPRPLAPQTNAFRQRPRNDLQPDPCASSTAGGCIRSPIKIKDVKPIFPAGTDAGTGTQVVLEGRIGADGFMAGMHVVSAADQGFANAALNAVNAWEFLPTELDGQPIDTRIKVMVNFVGAR